MVANKNNRRSRAQISILHLQPGGLSLTTTKFFGLTCPVAKSVDSLAPPAMESGRVIFAAFTFIVLLVSVSETAWASTGFAVVEVVGKRISLLLLTGGKKESQPGMVLVSLSVWGSAF